jgi:hypothetical protein
MKRDLQGEYAETSVGGEVVRAFIPSPLPPIPALDLAGEREGLVERATLAIGRLDSVGILLPDPQLFLYAYVRKEAVLSSQIEGTQSSLSDLLLFELDEQPGVPMELPSTTAWPDLLAASRSAIDSCERCTNGSWPGPVETRNLPATSAGRRTGSAGFVPARRISCLRRLTRSSLAWPNSNCSCTDKPRAALILFPRQRLLKPPSLTSNLKRSILFLMATAASVGC